MKNTLREHFFEADSDGGISNWEVPNFRFYEGDVTG